MPAKRKKRHSRRKTAPRKVSRHAQWCIIMLLAVVLVLIACRTVYVPVSSPQQTPQTESATTTATQTSAGFIPVRGLEVPYVHDITFLVENPDGRYTLLYDTTYRQASWVAYLLTRRDVQTKGARRNNRFVADPQVKTKGWPTATTAHYTGSGYDRGHLLPSADRNDTQMANDATFHLSNISPQRPSLNRGQWKKLEERVRVWAERYDSLYVVTGGVLTPGLSCIKGGVGVPRQFFKAVMTCHGGEWHSVGFLLPNDADITGSWVDYIVTVDSLESVTGFDFFHLLPADIQARTESSYKTSMWK